MAKGWVGCEAKVWVECRGSEIMGWLWDDEEGEYRRKNSKTEMSASIKLRNDFIKFTDRFTFRCFIPDEKRLLLFLVSILVTLIIVEGRGATVLISEKSTS